MKKIRRELFNVDVDCLTMEETTEVIDQAISEHRQIVHNCINANKVVLMARDRVLYESVKNADLVSADGQAIVWASRLFKRPLPLRVPGIDLMDNLIDIAFKKNYKIYFFGATQEIVEKVVEIYTLKYSSDLIAGFRNGYFSREEEPEIAREINRSGCSILFVAIPSPQKESFISQYRQKMSDVYVLMGVGGSLDVIAGKVKRAPRWMQDNGLEWLFRLIQEPRKMWRRYLIGNFRFLYLVYREFWEK